ncbi:MAG: hypothetical protein V4592_14750 [Bacteroidota bacterium]
MKDTIYLLIKVTVETTHSNIYDAIREFQSLTEYSVSSTPNVKVLITEIMDLTKSGKV